MAYNHTYNETWKGFLDLTNDTVTGNYNKIEVDGEDDSKCYAADTRIAILTPVAIFGILGNILSFLVLKWRYPQTSVNFYLKMLAIADTLFLFVGIIVGLMERFETDFTSYSWAIFKFVIRRVIQQICQTVSVWIIVILSFTRYVAISQPLELRSSCPVHKAKISILLIIAISVAVNVIHLGSTVTCWPNKDVDNMLYYCEIDTYTLWKRYFTMGYYLGCMFILPIIPNLYFNLSLLKYLFCFHHNRHEDLPNLSRELRNISKTILVIVIVFLISYLPFAIYAVLEMIPPAMEYLISHHCFAQYVRVVLITAYHLNSCVNFLIYVCFKDSFYNHLKLTFSNNSYSAPNCLPRSNDIEI